VSKVIDLLSESPRRTLSIGNALGQTLEAGDFVAVSGPLGAGKTQLVKGIGRGLGVAANEPVVSPTFVLVREYCGRLKLYHVDAYRLHGPAELLALGLEDMRDEPGSVVAVEWADRVAELIPPEAIQIHLEHESPTARRIRLDLADEHRRAELAARLRRPSDRADRPA